MQFRGPFRGTPEAVGNLWATRLPQVGVPAAAQDRGSGSLPTERPIPPHQQLTIGVAFCDAQLRGSRVAYAFGGPV